MNKTENINDVRADILSRPNSLNDRYAKANFGLTGSEIFSFTGSPSALRNKADLVDEMISREMARGKNVDDPEVLKVIAYAIEKTSVSEKTFIGGLFSIAIIAVIIFFLINLFS